MQQVEPTTAATPTRRFGPVTLLALIGGTVFGLLGTVIAQNFVPADWMRGVLVSSICLGAGLGVLAGAAIESCRHRVLLQPLATLSPWRVGRWILILGAADVGLALLVAICVFPSSGVPLGHLLLRVFLPQIHRLPMLVVWIVGVIAARHYWQRHRRASQLLLTGLIGLALCVVAQSFANLDLQLISAGGIRWTGSGGISIVALQALYFIWRLLRSLVAACSCGLIVAAVFAERPTSTPK